MNWKQDPRHLHLVAARSGVLTLMLLFLVACSAQDLMPPRLAPPAPAARVATPEAAEPLYLAAPTATVDPALRSEAKFESSPAIEVWINETSPEHDAMLHSMMDDFTEQSGINVALRLVSPMLLPDLMHTAVLSNTLPDVVLHPIEYTMAWREEGVLDTQTTAAIIEEIGSDTFNPGAIDLVTFNGQPSAIPSDGFQQIWLYRSDWLAEQGLDTPDNYDGMLTMAETMFDPDNITSGLVIPTESNLINTHRAFEHLATANGCRLIDDKGEVRLLDAACRDALDFYFSIVNQYSPPGVQTDTSAHNAFLDDRTSIIMTSPSILPDLANTNRLDQNTGILTTLTGNGPEATPANFGNITYLGITPAADPVAAAAFASYWFNEGYPTWLEVESERKVPMRLGTSEDPSLFIDAWGTSPVVDGQSLSELYGQDIVDLLRDGLTETERWGFEQGQGVLVGQLYENLTFSVVLQEMLSGYFNTTKTIQEAANRVIELIPNYQFTVEPTPTPAPTPTAET
jgi:multiple sugar transport system substrate-binding protein